MRPTTESAGLSNCAPISIKTGHFGTSNSARPVVLSIMAVVMSSGFVSPEILPRTRFSQRDMFNA